MLPKIMQWLRAKYRLSLHQDVDSYVFWPPESKNGKSDPHKRDYH